MGNASIDNRQQMLAHNLSYINTKRRAAKIQRW